MILDSTDWLEAPFGKLAMILVRDEGRLYLTLAEGRARLSQFVPLSPQVALEVVRGRSVAIPDLGPAPFELIQEDGVMTFRRGANSVVGPAAPLVRMLREMGVERDLFEGTLWHPVVTKAGKRRGSRR